MSTLLPAPVSAQLLIDLTTLTLPQLVESADEVLGYPDEPGMIAWAEDCGIAWTAHGVAVVDVPGFVEMWGLPVTHARAAEIYTAIVQHDRAPLLPQMTAKDCKREVYRAQDRAELVAEHGGYCDCHDCYDMRPLVDVGDLKFVAAVGGAQ